MSPLSRQIFRNATLTVVQVVLSAAFLFFIYRYLLGAIGAEQMGVWSIVMALSTLARITDLGFAGGMTRFVAKYRALDQEESVLEVVETGTVSLAVLAIGMLALSYPLLVALLPHVLNAQSAELAVLLLPYSLTSFGLLAIAGSFLSSLDGLQRADLRNLLLITGTVLYGLLIPLCVESLGFVGLGWAQLGQSLAVLFGSFWVLRTQLDLGWWPRRWCRSRFREMLGYNVSMQVTTLAAFLGDPLTKLMLGHFGGMGSVAFYEMSTKMVNQFRAVVTNVNQVMVPVITRLHEQGEDELKPLYRQTYGLMFFVCAAFYALAFVTVPTISWLWIGHSQPFFIGVAYVMLVTMFLNTLSAPAYFSNLGTGHANVNAYSQVLIGVINLALGAVFGGVFGGAGVVVAYALAVLLGSAFLMQRFFQLHRLDWLESLPRTGRPQVVFMLGSAAAAAGAAHLIQKGPTIPALMVTGFAAILGAAWMSPVRTECLALARKIRQPGQVAPNELGNP